MDENKDLTEKLSNIFLRQIIKSLRSEEITIEQSKLLAQEFLKLEPYVSIDDARAKIHAFIEKYPQFDSMKTYINSYKDELNTNKVIEMMKKHLQDNDIDKALEVAKNNT